MSLMKYSSFRIIILLFLIASNFYNLSAQDVDINNLSNLNVEELSDEQIQKFIERVEAGGYTEDQLVVLARARGMSELQIQKLRQRIEEVRSGATAKSAGGTTGITRLRDPLKLKGEENEPVGLDPFASVFPEDTLKDKDELEIFGMSFFKSERSAFEPSVNVPTPKNYVIGPGDGIIIDIWGAFEYTYDLTVSPEGVIRIADVGPIQVSGLSVDEASNKIKQRLKSIYSTLGQNAFADVSLGQIRTINVNVVGEVKIPGSYSTTSFSTAFNALYLAGGPNESGSLRVIDVFRSGKKVATLDAYDYLIRGGGSTINLQDEDVIIVRPYINRVSIYGEVKRPAIYELSLIHI